MSHFSYVSTVWNTMCNLIIDVPQSFVSWISTDDGYDKPVEKVVPAVPGSMIMDEAKKEMDEITDIAEKDADFLEEQKSAEDDDFEIINDHDLYVIFHENEHGIETEENFHINLEESTKYH